MKAMKNLYEIFEEIEKAQTDNEKAEILQKNDSYALRSVLQGIYSDSVKFSVERVPYYKPSDSPIGLGYTSIAQELDRTYLFQENHPRIPQGLTEKRKEEILIQILESLEAKEAVVFMNMLLKKPVKNLSKKVVKKVYGSLIQ